MLDIIVVGSGLVGATFLSALQHTELKIAVVEKQLPASVVGDTQDQRPISLARLTQLYLSELGVWSAIQAQAGPIARVHVSEAGKLGALRFTDADFDGHAPGAVLPMQALQKAVYQKAADNPHVQFVMSDDLRGIEQTPDAIALTYQNAEGEQTLQAKLLVAADGANSPCRALLGIEADVTDHHDLALTAILDIQTPHDQTAYERFTDVGVMAILPMWDAHQLRLVWTMDKKHIETLDEQKILAALSKYFGNRLPRVTACHRTGEYPLRTIIAKKQMKGRAVLLGDSAHRFYPLSAQGYNLSVRDVRVLSHLLHKAIRHKEDIGATTLLEHYVSQRQSAQKNVARVTKGLECIFGLRLPLVGHLRSAGLLAADMLPPFKQSIIDAIGG